MNMFYNGNCFPLLIFVFVSVVSGDMVVQFLWEYVSTRYMSSRRKLLVQRLIMLPSTPFIYSYVGTVPTQFHTKTICTFVVNTSRTTNIGKSC